jgi:MFS family permease
MRTRRGLVGVLAVLMATGWAANHFASVIPVLSDEEGLSASLLDGVFGIYALGLLPGLFAGGAMSDRLGRPRVVLPGALLAAVGTTTLLVSHEPVGLLLGRLVVGLGAGLTFGAGTAWAADLGGTQGTVLAGVFLTTGFGVGPLVSGLLAQWAPYPLETPFVVSLALSLAAVLLALIWAVPLAPDTAARAGAVKTPAAGSAGAALAWSLPVGLLVFASAIITIVTLPARLPSRYDGPALVGLSGALTLSFGIAVQTLARGRRWGPRAGVVGALCSAAGFGIAASAGEHIGIPLLVAVCALMGLAYGLCLREGLLDVESLAPGGQRGLLTGVFYVVTYIGFGLPLLLVLVHPALGASSPLAVCSLIALLVAATRTVQLRSGHPAR